MNLTKSDNSELCNYFRTQIELEESLLSEAGKPAPARPNVTDESEQSADVLEGHLTKLESLRGARIAPTAAHTGRRLAATADSQPMAAKDQSADAKAIAAADAYDALPGVRIIQPVKMTIQQRCIRAAGCKNYEELSAKRHEEGLARLEKAGIPRRVLSGQK